MWFGCCDVRGDYMASITQHIPSFFEGIEPSIEIFVTEAELLAIPFVRNFSIDTRFGDEQEETFFCRYSLNGNILMADCGHGCNISYVIGTISDTNGLNLPEWIHKE